MRPLCGIDDEVRTPDALFLQITTHLPRHDRAQARCGSGV
jgi:hypothetical protein